ncbi:glycosyltransferase [Saccharothrix isguenensis]
MRTLIATRRLAPPFFLGGVEVNHRVLGEALVSAGHEVLHFGSYVHPRWRDHRLLPDVLARLGATPSGAAPASGVVSYSGPYGDVVMSAEAGFLRRLEATLAEYRPDVLLTTCVGSGDICRTAARMKVRSVAWVQDVGEDGRETFLAPADRKLYASRYLSGFFGAGGGDAVFYPPFTPLPFLPPAPSPRTVLMVNAIPEKGSDTFLALAHARPDLRFTALTGWRRPEWAGSAPANVSCVDRADDPVSVYRAADVVLVPSPLPEGFGRVAVEAALLGRRVLCHDVGGLGEAAGLAENLLPDLGRTTWLDALSDAVVERDARPELLRRSRRHAERFVRPVAPDFLRVLGESPSD